MFNQGRRDSFAPMPRCYGKIIDIDLATLLLELSKLVSCDAADHFAALHCGQRNESIAVKQLPQIVLAGTVRGVGVGFVESFAERCQQRFHQRDIIRSEMADIYRHRERSPKS